MSLLDNNIIGQTDQICYDKVKEDIDMFISKHMSVNHIFTDHIFTAVKGFNTNNDCSSFSYGFLTYPEENSADYPYPTPTAVLCCIPILDTETLKLIYDKTYHQFPFIIHDYDGESLPDYIKFISMAYYYEDAAIDDRIYSSGISRNYGILTKRLLPVKIYIHNCPNLKIDDPYIETCILR